MKAMKVVAKTMMILSVVAITTASLLISRSEVGYLDYASAAVPPPSPSQKKVIVKNLRMA
jgi:hypothetical protein